MVIKQKDMKIMKIKLEMGHNIISKVKFQYLRDEGKFTNKENLIL